MCCGLCVVLSSKPRTWTWYIVVIYNVCYYVNNSHFLSVHLYTMLHVPETSQSFPKLHVHNDLIRRRNKYYSKLYLSLRLFRRAVHDLTSSLTVKNQCCRTLNVPMLCLCLRESESRLRDQSTLNLRTNSSRTSLPTLTLGIRAPGDESGSSRSMSSYIF